MAEIPAWVEFTPFDLEYSLTMYENGGSVQNIDTTRDEYLALKAHLAAMRGYLIGTAEKEVGELQINEEFISEFGRHGDSQQDARHLQLARTIYRAHPDAVVFQSTTFDEQLEEIAK